MLPVLKKAGVVDAGGRGLIIIFKGMEKIILGEEDFDINKAQLYVKKGNTIEPVGNEAWDIENEYYTQKMHTLIYFELKI